MSRLSISIPIVLVLWFLPSNSSAEFYKYTDQNGTVHYTDDLYKVPDNHRDKVSRFAEPDDYLTPEQRKKKVAESSHNAQEQNEGNASAEEQEEQTKVEKKEIEEKREIDGKKAQLDKEYNLLTRERKELKSKRPAIKTPKDLRSYNIKAEKLNQRIADFEQRNQIFKKKAEQVKLKMREHKDE